MSRSLWSSSPAVEGSTSIAVVRGKTIDCYQIYVNEEIAVRSIDKPKDHPTECNALWTGADLLKTISNLNVDLLTTEELALLERQQATLLGQTRQRKTGLTMEAVATLWEKASISCSFFRVDFIPLCNMLVVYVGMGDILSMIKKSGRRRSYPGPVSQSL